MTVVCMHCKIEYGVKEGDGVSHGICHKCFYRHYQNPVWIVRWLEIGEGGVINEYEKFFDSPEARSEFMEEVESKKEFNLFSFIGSYRAREK